MRILLIFIALAIIVMIVRRLWLKPPASDGQRKRLSGQMVQCRTCGMYVPEQEALRHADHWYCSQEHLDTDRRQE